MRSPAWTLVGLLALVPVAALADAKSKKQALVLFDQARALAKQGKQGEACQKFSQSFELDPAPGTRLNVADCFESKGQLIRAKEWFEIAAAEFERLRQGDQAKYARTRVEAIVPRLATVVLELPGAVPGTRVKIGARELPSAPRLEQKIDPGPIEIVITSPGRPPITKRETIAAGATATIAVPAPVATTRVESPPRPPLDTATRRKRGRVKLSLGLGIGGGVSLIASTALGWYAKRAYDKAVDGPECTRTPFACSEKGLDEVDRSQSIATISTGAGIAAGVLLIGAGIVYFTAPREQLTITPTASVESVGIAVGRAF